MVRAALLFRVTASQSVDASQSTPICETDRDGICVATLQNATIVQEADGQNVFSFVNPPANVNRAFSRVDVVPPSLPPVNELTVTMWVKVTDPLSFRNPARFLASRLSNNNGLSLSVLPSPNLDSPFGFLADLRLTTRHMSGGNVSDFNFVNNRGAPKVIFPHRWHHVAAVLNSTHAALFLDTVVLRRDARTPGTVPFLPGQIFTVGGTRNDAPGSEYAGITGFMDDVRLYDEALSVEQLKAVFYGFASNESLAADAIFPHVFTTADFLLKDLGNDVPANRTRVVSPLVVSFTADPVVAAAFINGNGTATGGSGKPVTLPFVVNVTEGWLLVRVAPVPPKLAALEGVGAQFSLGFFREPSSALFPIFSSGTRNNVPLFQCQSATRSLFQAQRNSAWLWAPFNAFECSPAGDALSFSVRFSTVTNATTVTTVDVRLYEWIVNPFLEIDPVADRPRPILATRGQPQTTAATTTAATTTRTSTTGTPSSTRSTALATNSTAAPVGGDPAAPSGGNLGAIIGGVVGGIAALALIVGGVLFWRKRSASSSATPPVVVGTSNYGKIDLPQRPEYDSALAQLS